MIVAKNKSRGKRSKHWVLTLNNPTSEDGVEPNDFEYLILGKEVGEEGTPHLQGYCVFKNRQYLSGAKKVWPRAHLEIKRGTVEEAITYCKKDGKFEEWGVVPMESGYVEKKRWIDAYESAKARDFEAIPKDMLVRCYHNFKRIAQDNPEIPDDLGEKKNYWIFAPSQYGKSEYVRKRWGPAKKYIYDKAPNKWWVGYKNQPTIMLEDYGPKQCKHLGWYMKRWADRFSFPIESKGGGRQIRPERIVVTSQYTIEECFADKLEREAIKNRFELLKIKKWKKGQDMAEVEDGKRPPKKRRIESENINSINGGYAPFNKSVSEMAKMSYEDLQMYYEDKKERRELREKKEIDDACGL